MFITDFFKYINGKKIDYDGRYQNQCVDLIKVFEDIVLSITPEACGDAWEYYANYDNSRFLKNHFERIPNSPDFVPKLGDIAVFNRGYGRYGHVCICTGEGNVNRFFSYDQNKGGNHEPCQKCEHNYLFLDGVLRPRYRGNIDIQPTKKYVKVICDILNVRAGAGLKYMITVQVRKGEVFTITETKKADRYTWGKLKSGVGWIALEYTKEVIL